MSKTHFSLSVAKRDIAANGRFRSEAVEVFIMLKSVAVVHKSSLSKRQRQAALRLFVAGHIKCDSFIEGVWIEQFADDSNDTDRRYYL